MLQNEKFLPSLRYVQSQCKSSKAKAKEKMEKIQIIQFCLHTFTALILSNSQMINVLCSLLPIPDSAVKLGSSYEAKTLVRQEQGSVKC